MPHNEFDVAMATPTIVLSTDDLPEVREWEVGARYDITKLWKNAKQVEKTEFEDGKVVVVLQVKPEEPKIEGDLAKENKK